jgi:hypothetical protein
MFVEGDESEEKMVIMRNQDLGHRQKTWPWGLERHKYPEPTRRRERVCEGAK